MKAIDTCSAQLLPVDHQLSRGGCSTVSEFVTFECTDDVVDCVSACKNGLFNSPLHLALLNLCDRQGVVAPSIGVAEVDPRAFPFADEGVGISGLRPNFRKCGLSDQRETCQHDEAVADRKKKRAHGVPPDSRSLGPSQMPRTMTSRRINPKVRGRQREHSTERN